MKLGFVTGFARTWIWMGVALHALASAGAMASSEPGGQGMDPRRARSASANVPPLTSDKPLLHLHTTAGDLVFELDPKSAPRHVEQITRLANAGVYDATPFLTLVPGKYIQLGTVLGRRMPLTTDQNALIKKIPGEFRGKLRHERGVLTMARHEKDRNSAETSFAILFTAAPKMDGKYSAFGKLVNGFDVLELLERAPVNDSGVPTVLIEIQGARVLAPGTAYRMSPRNDAFLAGLAPKAGPVPGGGSGLYTVVPVSSPPTVARMAGVSVAAGALLAVTVGSLLLVWGAGRWEIRTQRGVGLLVVLVACYGWLSLMMLPRAQRDDVRALAIFLGLVLLFRLLGGGERESSEEGEEKAPSTGMSAQDRSLPSGSK